MKRKKEIKKLAESLSAKNKYTELQQALTHFSFYLPEENKKASDRYVFLGMYAFKGKLAEILFSYIPGNGKQLQHLLGNLFKTKQLDKIFYKFELQKFIRYGENFDAEKHRHIFVYGFLGFVFKHGSKKVLRNFIFENFLKNADNLFSNLRKNKDLHAQCNYFSMILYQKKVKINIFELSKEMFCAEVKVLNNIIASAESKSYKYVRKKALKIAIKNLSNELAQRYEQTEEYKERRKEEEIRKAKEKEALKAEKEKIRLEKLEKRKAENRIKRAKRKAEAQKKDLERRKAKQRLKQRTEAKKIRQKIQNSVCLKDTPSLANKPKSGISVTVAREISDLE